MTNSKIKKKHYEFGRKFGRAMRTRFLSQLEQTPILKDLPKRDKENIADHVRNYVLRGFEYGSIPLKLLCESKTEIDKLIV